MQAYRLRGWNDYYAGWLARALNQPRKLTENVFWKDGWDYMDALTEENRRNAFYTELENTMGGQVPAYIIIEEVDQV